MGALNSSFSRSHGAAHWDNNKFMKPRPAVLARLKAANEMELFTD